MNYDYKEASARIQKIFDNQLIISADSFKPDKSTYGYHGTKTWIGVLAISFMDFELVLEKLDDNRKTQIAKSLFQEIIAILRQGPTLHSLTIKNDGVVAVYAAQYRNDLLAIFDIAVIINTFSKMYNKVLNAHEIVSIPIGVGISANKEIVIKMSVDNVYCLNDLYWLGDSVNEAQKFALEANKRSTNAIVFSNLIFKNIMELLKKRNANFVNWIIPKYYDNKPNEDDYIEYYHCNVVKINFDKWINEEMVL